MLQLKEMRIRNELNGNQNEEITEIFSAKDDRTVKSHIYIIFTSDI